MDSTLRYVLLGSCFAQNIGQRMCRDGWDAVVNPLGTLYNPESLRSSLSQALEGGELPFFFDEDMQEWRCWLANTHFRASSREECALLVGEAFAALRDRLLTADILILTLGTNVVYTTPSPVCPGQPLVVANCQRQPDRLFREERMDVAGVTASLLELLRCLHRHNPRCRVLLTISPYRYRKYGLHGNALSKAVLLLAVENVQREHPSVMYFPSFEIMIDELRDYKFYASDGLHPSEEAIDILWKRFQEFPIG